MFNQIISLENLFSAWQEFRSGKRSREDVGLYERNVEDHIFALHEDLSSGVYVHGAYQQFHIFDPKHRVIHKATIRDRVVHHAIYRVLLPLFDRSFIFDSYSCRNEKGTHAAVRRLEDFSRKLSKNYTEAVWVLKFDIRRFFDSVDHGILLEILHASIHDERTMALLRDIVESFSIQHSSPQLRGGGAIEGHLRKTGLPIGNLTSQLFANVYMNTFDHFIKENLREKFYIRYTDDAVILDRDPERLRGLIPWIQAWLWRHRVLDLHPRKVEIRKLQQGIDFLGYVTRPHHRILRTMSARRMMKKIDETNVTSYRGMLEHCEGYTLEKRLTHVILSSKN